MPRKKELIASQDLIGLATASLPFFIRKMGPINQEQVATMEDAHRHNYHMLAIAIDGFSEHMIDMQPFTMQGGQMALIVSGQVHKAKPGYNGSGYALAFTADFVPQLDIPVTLVGPVTIPQPELADVLQLLAMMEREYMHQQAHTIAILQYGLAILLQVLQRHSADAAPVSNSIILRYQELLSCHYLEWTKPAQYAEALHISVDYLNEVVQQYYGQTASSLITARRVLEAKRLLSHTNESVKEIAWHLKFNEVSYFIRFFKQHAGCTPTAFRENNREMSTSDPE
jgi:AraC-like DNA-binding protein